MSKHPNTRRMDALLLEFTRDAVASGLRGPEVVAVLMKMNHAIITAHDAREDQTRLVKLVVECMFISFPDACQRAGYLRAQ